MNSYDKLIIRPVKNNIAACLIPSDPRSETDAVSHTLSLPVDVNYLALRRDKYKI